VVPYGPFIALAAVVAILWGDSLISYYVNNWLLPG
jgi:leader peptidase (prepilin peptidase)/N-methyltransferase